MDFSSPGSHGGKDARFAKDHVSDSGVQGVLQRTLKHLGFKKHVHPHVFRHAYATHLLEANIPIRHVQKILGHKTLKSTMIYLHVTTQAQIFRAKFRDEMKKANLLHKINSSIWEQEWVVDSQGVGKAQNSLRSLARYVFRVAIYNNRIKSIENDDG